MLSPTIDEQITQTCDLLCTYFVEHAEATLVTKTALHVIKKDFAGESNATLAEKIADPVTTAKTMLNWAWSGYNPKQINRIDKTLKNIPDADSAEGVPRGLITLQEVVLLLGKSETKNWSAGKSIADQNIISPSLNNRLVCTLLASAGGSIDPLFLEQNGELFLGILKEKVGIASAACVVEMRVRQEISPNSSRQSSDVRSSGVKDDVLDHLIDVVSGKPNGKPPAVPERYQGARSGMGYS